MKGRWEAYLSQRGMLLKLKDGAVTGQVKVVRVLEVRVLKQDTDVGEGSAN